MAVPLWLRQEHTIKNVYVSGQEQMWNTLDNPHA